MASHRTFLFFLVSILCSSVISAQTRDDGGKPLSGNTKPGGSWKSFNKRAIPKTDYSKSWLISKKQTLKNLNQISSRSSKSRTASTFGLIPYKTAGLSLGMSYRKARKSIAIIDHIKLIHKQGRCISRIFGRQKIDTVTALFYENRIYKLIRREMLNRSSAIRRVKNQVKANGGGVKSDAGTVWKGRKRIFSLKLTPVTRKKTLLTTTIVNHKIEKLARSYAILQPVTTDLLQSLNRKPAKRRFDPANRVNLPHRNRRWSRSPSVSRSYESRTPKKPTRSQAKSEYLQWKQRHKKK